MRCKHGYEWNWQGCQECWPATPRAAEEPKVVPGADVRAYDELVAELRAEVERLKAELADAVGNKNIWFQEYSSEHRRARQAEAERDALEAELAERDTGPGMVIEHLEANVATLRHQLAEAKAESARLRGNGHDYRTHWEGMAAQLQQDNIDLRSRIEALADALAKLRRLLEEKKSPGQAETTGIE